MDLQRSAPPWGYIIIALLMLFIVNGEGYMVLVPDTTQVGEVIFNASVYKLGSERNYKINVHRTASFVHHILKVDKKSGQIILKKKLKCNGVLYPNLFTFYVDSTSDRIRDIDYYSLPVRILITGPDCSRKSEDVFDIEFDRVYDQEDAAEEFDDEPYFRDKRDLNKYADIQNIDWRLLEDDDNETSHNWLIDSNWSDGMVYDIDNYNKRKKRSHDTLPFDMSIDVKLSEAKQWISETFASFAIPTTDKWQGICLKSSQFINSLTAFLPQSIRKSCKVQFLDVNDDRFAIETSQGDLVAAKDVCVLEPLWKVTVLFTFNCKDPNLIDSDHRLKLVYHHQEFNDTDMAKRVRRELRNQSPYFEQALYIAAVAEEQPPGAIVTTVRARDPENSPVTYSMSSLLDSRSAGMFTVDEHTGVISTLQRLDRERLDVHYFRIVAQDDTFPPRSGTTTLQINVLDCNDHAPVFELQQYETSVREGASPGTTILTLRATDQDVGKNAEIEYSIDSVTYEPTLSETYSETTNESSTEVLSSEESMEIYRVDGRSGVLHTRSVLDREKVSKYIIIVKATDQASPVGDRMSSSATVIVNVLDDNDNYPQFSEKTYTVSVDEDINLSDNPVIAHIRATDADAGVNAVVRYAIIGGNTQMQFSIDTMSGDVSLVKPLDYELVRSYRLVIRAQDGGSPSRSNTTQLLVNVKDVNDNSPRFYTSLFQESVSESVPVGYSIVRVQAYDADEGVNAEIIYSLTERDRNMEELPLTIDSRTGWVYTVRSLDRETQPKFQLQVTAKDGGDPPRTATASLVITVSDVNDNDPVFSPSHYEANLAEDETPGTPVATLTATDADEDTRLHYEITGGNTRGRFAITSQNGRGLITVAQPLDYKQEKRYVLSVTATDSGGRFDTATVSINITDANNYAPVFENAPYTASVFEDAPVGTTVLVVSATDSDVGINAQITYSLSSEMSSEMTGVGHEREFIINPHTGAILTNKPLDRETMSGYLLTVTARDGGVPSLSDTTDVEISVVDVNDNAPMFKQPLYSASIPEDALVGTSVTTVSAWDADSGLNGRVHYRLDDNDEGTFAVDSSSGVIRTNKALDRESTPAYDLKVLAVDGGSPSMSSTVIVHIRIEDINDSPPVFESDRITFYVPENSPIGTTVGEIYAHDPDEGNNAIVHYSIKGGDDSNSFSLETRQGSDRAILVTMVDLDYESPRKKYELIIRAASPPLWNDVNVDIMVTDVNDNAPVMKDFHVIFNNYKNCFPVGAFGRVPAFDADVSDKLIYRILSGNNANLILLNETTGYMTLSPQLNTNVAKVANMEISVSDGVNEIKAMMQLSVRLVTEEMLFNSINVRLNEMTAEQFLSPLLGFFVDGLAAIIPCPKENIYIFSIQEDTSFGAQVLNVSVSVRKVEGSGFLSPAYLRERLYLHRATLARLATLQVLPFDDNICVHEPCVNFEECLSVLKFGNASGFVSSDTVLFRPIYPVTTFACQCPKGFTGLHEHYMCDTEVDLCYSSPCMNNGTCVRREGGYTCVCTSGYTGVLCESRITKNMACESCGACTGTSCCTDVACELKARSFTRSSFLTFPSLKQRYRFNIKLRFATVHTNGLLLYNGRYNEKHDFVALEVISTGAGITNGLGIKFSFSLGGTPTSVTLSGNVADGNWHTVEIDYKNRTAAILLDNCDKRLALVAGAQLGIQWACANETTKSLPDRCRLPTETCHRFLDLTGPLQLGGLPSIPSNFQVNTRDFIGCVSDLHIDHRFIDLNSFVADNGTEVGCSQKRAHCSSSPCHNGAKCNELWDTFLCECREGYTGKDCSEPTTVPWRFSGDGTLSFNPLLRPIQLPWLNALSLRTRQTDGFLMSIQIGQNSSVLIVLKSGYLQYSYNGESIELPTAMLADGEWHRVEIKWLGNDLSVNIDYGSRNNLIPMLANKIQGQYIGKILIGGLDTAAGLLASEYGYFEGCIQDVRVGNYQSLLNRPTVRENVRDGCQSKADCTLSACPTHGSCLERWDGVECVCDAGRVGPACLSPCELNVCPSNAVCHVQPEQLHGYTCRCPPGTVLTESGCDVEMKKECPPGWWGTGACGPCNCSVDYGYHPHCNRTTGQCYCKERHYEASKGKCSECSCYAPGSRGAECSATGSSRFGGANGQCPCRRGVVGRACDTCLSLYAEVTTEGCQVVYDGCPRSFSNGVWWPRTKFGESATVDCPKKSSGKASRSCDKTETIPWLEPDMFNCTSESFYQLRKQLADVESGRLQVNTFVSVRLAYELELACSTTEHLYGADVLVTHGILLALLEHEGRQAGLNLTHSQDKDYVKNIMKSASKILDKIYNKEWIRIEKLTGHGVDYLMRQFDKYIGVLAESQHDTYTNPFEVITEKLIIGVDVITAESIYGFETSQTIKNQYKDIFSSEKVVLPDTTMFIHPPLQGTDYYLKTKTQPGPTVSFPKYNNYIRNEDRFDKYTRVLVPLDLLGINAEDGGRAAIAYFQWSRQDAVKLLGTSADESVSVRWPINLTLASSPIEIVIYVPQHIVQYVHDNNYIKNSYGIPYTNKGNKIFNEYNKNTNHDIHNKPKNMKMSTTTDHSPVIIQPNFKKHEQNINDAYNKEQVGPKAMPLVSDNIDIEKSGEEKKLVYKSLSGIRLKTPIRLQMWLDVNPDLFDSRTNPQCVHWSIVDGRGEWSRVGCHTEIDYNWEPTSGDPLLINCTCYHLSMFAVLTDDIDIEMIPEPSFLEQVSSYSGFSVSMPLLFITLIALCAVRGGAATVSNTIHKHMIFSMFMAELLYFIALKNRSLLVKNEIWCRVTSMCLQYWWSAACWWLALDARHTARLSREVRDVNHGPAHHYLAVAYAAPAVLLALAVGAHPQHFGNAMFCWISCQSPGIWWGVASSALALLVTAVSLIIAVHAVFTAKEHIVDYGNLRRCVCVCCICCACWWWCWGCAVVRACEWGAARGPLTAILAAALVVHAVALIAGYLIFNNTLRQNLKRTALRCMGKKVPLDSSVVISPSSQNISQANRSALAYHSGGDGTRTLRHIGISASSTTSRSTNKTSSSPYSRSDGQLRHTSTSTSNYNSTSDMPAYLRGFDSSLHDRKAEASRRKSRDTEGDSDSSQSPPPSLDLASSHSSDDEDLPPGPAGHNQGGYLPNITEGSVLGPSSQEWQPSSRLPASPLPNPDLTADAIKQTSSKPSLLDNIHDTYITNVHHGNGTSGMTLDNRFGCLESGYPLSYTSDNVQYSNNQYTDPDYVSYTPNYNTQLYATAHHDYGNTPRDNQYGSRDYQEKNYATRDFRDSGIATLLKDDYQRKLDAEYAPEYVERMSEGSDRHYPHEKYRFPYTAEEDHTSIRGMNQSPQVHHEHHTYIHHDLHQRMNAAPLASMGESSEKSTIEDDAETRV